MLRDVKGTGTLVPEDPLWIPAANEGQVSKIMVQSGDRVKPDTVLLVLTNPDMELAANDLEWQVKQAEADLTGLKVNARKRAFEPAVGRLSRGERPRTSQAHEGTG